MNNQQIANRFKIRCSAIGKIMTNGRGKEPKMGKTAQSYCLDWIKQQPEFYNRRREFSNKYTEKGLIVEDHSIDFVAEYLDCGMLIKNEKQYENDFMTGTPDIITINEIIDVKNSFDPFTFPLFETGLPSTDYWWQGQGYMCLADRSKYEVIYTLMDTPINIIEREARSYCYKNGFDPNDAEIMDRHVKQMTYGDVAPENRIKVFKFDFEQGAIDQIEMRVKECREFIFDTLENLIR